jgi:hypothetical protein
MWQRALVLVAVAVAVGGCGAEAASTPPAPPVPSGWTAHRDDGAGLSVRFPSAWHRAPRSLTPDLGQPHELLSLGTFPLRHAKSRCGHLPAGALRRMGPRDVFVTVQESGGRTRGFRPRARPLRLGRETSDVSACLGRPVPFAEHRIAFRDGGRAFHVLAAVGRQAPPASRSDLLAVLDSLQIDAAPGVRRMDPDTSVAFDRNGITGLLPMSWRLERRTLTAAVGPRAQLAFGSYPVPKRPRDRNCTPKAAIDALPADGVFVFAFEYRHVTAGNSPAFPRGRCASRSARAGPTSASARRT